MSAEHTKTITHVLAIGSTSYRVTAEPPPGRAFRMRQEPEHEGYRIERAGKKIVCTCPDYVHRRAGGPTRCKHGDAAERAGIL